jgi:glucose-1-phosphate adenylyltransferase
MLREHLMNKASLTIGAVRIPASESKRFGVFECEASGRVRSFQEKPGQGPEIPGQPGYCLGSMGIYVFETEELIERLRADAELGPESSHDFGKDVIPRMIAEERVFAHHFVDQGGRAEPYWRDVGTLDAYYDANFDLCSVQPQCNLYDQDWPIYSLWHNDPPAKTILSERNGVQSQLVDSLLCPGVVVSGATIRRSILSNRVYAQEDSLVEDSILFSGVVVGRGARLKRVIVDKWIEIPDGTVIGHDREADARRFLVTESGITVVSRGDRFE